mgnify:CR=1 FL=1
MIDQDLERRLADCKELLQLWHNFHQYFKLGVKGSDKITHEREADFLALKSRIAMMHDSFMDSLKHDQEIGQHVLSLVERSITLKHLTKLSIAEVKKMEIEWHESYLLLNETVALLEEQKENLAEISPTKYKTKKFLTSVWLTIQSIIGGMAFKIAVVIIMIPVGIMILNHFWPLSNLKNYSATEKAYYIAVDLYRSTLAPNLPYERIEDIPRKSGDWQNDLESTDGSFDKSSASNMFNQAGIASELRSGNTSFKEEAYKISGSSNRLYLFIFLFKGDNPNEKAINAVDQYRQWLNNTSSSTRANMEQNLTVFRKNNAFTVIFSPNKAKRAEIKEFEFKVRD